MRQRARGAGRQGPLYRGVAGGFRPEFVPKDPAGNRTAEQIDDATTGATYNTMNQLLSQQAGGALVIKGTVSEPASVTVGGRPATVTADNRFEGQAVVSGGTGQVAVTATDPSGNLRTNTYEVIQGATSKSFTYDANGNMTSDGTRTYEWDAENRLVTVKEGGSTVATYTYGHGGLRASSTVGGSTTSYVLDGASVVEERLGAASATKHFQGLGIDNVLAMQNGTGVVTYLTRDHLGSIREQVGAGGTSVVLRRNYDPWGRLTAGAGTAGWAFTGRENDVETGLYYYRARHYDPKVGRFVSQDPTRFDGGKDFYVYAADSPATLVDPTGRSCVYSQTTGVMCCKDDMTGEVYYHAVGYSGRGAAQNDPEWQDAPFAGPIPRGMWRVGPPDSTTLIHFFRRLTPEYPNECGNRSPSVFRPCWTFMIHGPGPSHPAESSLGCIVLPDSGRGIHTGESLRVVQ